MTAIEERECIKIEPVNPVNLLDLTRAGLCAWMTSIGEPAYRGTQICQWIHQKGVVDFDAMSNLSVVARQKLKARAVIILPQVIASHAVEEGTRKWLLQLQEGNCIEAVLIPERNRATLCVSSQVGCALNCSFCCTGKQGFSRNLTTAEIIGQLWIVFHDLRRLNVRPQITNVVMMGMGEPLLNYDAVVSAMRLMLDDYAYGLSKYRVTLSTSGVVPMLHNLKQDIPTALAISLHAPNDELRDELVPINKKYPLKELLAVCRDYFEAEPRRKVTFEYVMLKGVNDAPGQALALARLLQGIPAKINLIPFNSFEGTQYECSSPEAITGFHAILNEKGIVTTVRKTRGDKIAAACGQLAGQFKDRTQRLARFVRQMERARADRSGL